MKRLLVNILLLTCVFVGLAVSVILMAFFVFCALDGSSWWWLACFTYIIIIPAIFETIKEQKETER